MPFGNPQFAIENGPVRFLFAGIRKSGALNQALISKAEIIRVRTACRFGNRRYSRFGNLRYSSRLLPVLYENARMVWRLSFALAFLAGCQTSSCAFRRTRIV